MDLDRRSLVTFAVGAGVVATATAAAAGPRLTAPAAAPAPPPPDPSAEAEPAADETDEPKSAREKLEPNAPREQTQEMQAAIDECVSRGQPLLLAPGRYRVGHLELRPGSRIIGAYRMTTLEFAGGPAFITARNADGTSLEGLVLEGGLLPLDPSQSDAVVSFTGCADISLRDLEIRRGLLNGISLTKCSGRVTDCRVSFVSQAGVFSQDAEGLEIAHNWVSDCGNNGILVWRSDKGEDGTIVSANRIERIEARAGGSGENGNGINVFRAGNVLVTGNRIAKCAYTAIRGNAASNIQMVANSCSELGEVALYAEFGFEGAVIASNVVAGAASGIAVTNFNEGGRLAIVQGNLIRNLVRREQEPVDKRGEGISVEADAIVSGNVVESAATAGIVVGWGRYMRDVTVTQNLVRDAKVGIMVTADPGAGNCVVSQNMISGAKDGAIRAMSMGTPFGPDLAREASAATRVSVTGNVAV